MSAKFSTPELHALHSAEYTQKPTLIYPQKLKPTDLSDATRIEKTGHTGNTEARSSRTKATHYTRKRASYARLPGGLGAASISLSPLPPPDASASASASARSPGRCRSYIRI